MSAISAIYKLALARKGSSLPARRSGCHHNQTNKKLPDYAVVALRREYEAATKRGEKAAIVSRYASLYGATVLGIQNIVRYQSRSNPDRPLDPSLESAA